MANVVIYTTNNCPYCIAAKKLLNELNAKFEEVHIDGDDALREKMIKLTGKRTVPQIIIGDKSVGGFDDLSALHKSGTLQPMLDK